MRARNILPMMFSPPFPLPHFLTSADTVCAILTMHHAVITFQNRRALPLMVRRCSAPCRSIRRRSKFPGMRQMKAPTPQRTTRSEIVRQQASAISTWAVAIVWPARPRSFPGGTALHALHPARVPSLDVVLASPGKPLPGRRPRTAGDTAQPCNAGTIARIPAMPRFAVSSLLCSLSSRSCHWRGSNTPTRAICSADISFLLR
jgi:hypothetical protein